jgi:protocatechuate 3,4-dioxygenase beta subunit
MHDDNHDHDRGFLFDLSMLASRRRMLGLIGAGGTGVVLTACNLGGLIGSSEANETASAPDGSVCVKLPAETAGPFPGDGTNSRAGATVNVLTQSGIVRQDLRPSFAGMTPVAQGVQFDLAISLVDVSAACAPLAGHTVYVWHCDREGRYSLYDTEDSNYLRGVGITDAEGRLAFTTVFPGCYQGRWPHLHFEVFASPEKAVSGDASLLTSQFALPADVCQTVYGSAPGYDESVAYLSSLSLASDGIFRGNTPEQIAAQTIAMTGNPAEGYSGAVMVGIRNA